MKSRIAIQIFSLDTPQTTNWLRRYININLVFMVANRLLKWVNLIENLESMHKFREKTSSLVTG